MDGSVKSMMEESRSSFSKAGWNKSGSNMLATAVTLAKLRNLEARRYFFDFDIVGMVVTFALLAYFYFDLLFIHAVISGQKFQKVENDENRFFAITSSKLFKN